MRLSIFLFLFLSLSLSSCTDGKINSGEIEYEISYPYNDLSKIMEMMLPKTMTIVFKDDKMLTTIKKGNWFTTKVISNESTKALEMRLNMGSDIYNTNLKKNDITSLLSSQPKYNFSKPSKGVNIINCSSSYYDVDNPADSIDTFSSVFTTDFSIQNASWFSSYNEIKGLPLEYLVDRYGLIMKIKAIKLTKRDVKDSEFEPKFKYKELPYHKYNEKVQDLFNIMLD